MRKSYWKPLHGQESLVGTITMSSPERGGNSPILRGVSLLTSYKRVLGWRTGAKYTFTIKEGADSKKGRISVNYDGFIDDVSVNDMLLVDGGMLSLKIVEKTKQDVVCEVVDGGVMGSRYHHCLCCVLSL